VPSDGSQAVQFLHDLPLFDVFAGVYWQQCYVSFFYHHVEFGVLRQPSKRYNMNIVVPGKLPVAHSIVREDLPLRGPGS
jgi:hypothetical protein